MIPLHVIKIAVPFIKDMILGKNSFSYSVKKNKVRTLFFLSVLLSYGLNWIFVPKTFQISIDHVKLEKQVKTLEDQLTELNTVKDTLERDKQECFNKMVTCNIKPETKVDVTTIHNFKDIIEYERKNHK